MSSWKLIKSVMGAQLIWAAIAIVIAVIVAYGKGLFSGSTSNKKTKDGFQTNEMQELYNRYINKEMQYGQS